MIDSFIYLTNQNKVLLSLQNPRTPLDQNAIKSQQDEKESKQILQILEGEYKYSESEEEQQKKDEAAKQLRIIIKNWIQQINAEKQIENNHGGDLLFFGSYKLKVNSRGSDIDAVCLCPFYVEREKNFFGDLVHILSQKKEITELFPIQEASVPIIKMQFQGILFDLSFARAPTQFQSDKIDLTSNQMLLGMDERSCKSFNGYRVAEWLSKKENIQNYENFQSILKCIKLWAQNRGIYSNIIGYLSGIGWTILVSKICQLFPNYSLNQLLERFFFLYSRWRWQDFPVQVEYIVDDVANSKLSADQWRPEYKSSMMIITPCFPCMNCAHNVSSTTLRIIQEQLWHGYETICKIQNGSKNYSDLFKSFKFFKKYKHFLEIKILATNKNDYTVWKGHVESGLRKLTRLFESPQYMNLLEVHPYPSYIENFLDDTQSQKNKYKFQCKYYYGLMCLQSENNESINLKEACVYFVEQLEMYPMNKVLESMNIQCSHLLRSELNLKENMK
ncbi:nuclear poly polymerase npap nucleotidyltransferase protein binding, putative [Ichthyophthirius multifiliis]|uniref:Poly(A) polymerase n=1 Tax=Ichthyophthirius multifiliis TaxID=5932 RepID=G0QP64_ICHMU|nr:nuclear poly polymerase npap nucleotidyltransferase protein binding, putative [Ichthyophthirius multifiliis]EGR32994.1 nuclear poly polymerase npap nucleotidyltransferase protein binding, putative [Ichthyophthirius multifiliis]|eukprot:XP_004036980.1 nuclear poly polymerase npap nucleotidyltransferase protein binding, putative [Ichthyophthirius multifiliis]